jgi:hypothetical protein
VWFRLNVEHDLYEYIGTHTDDLLIIGPPGTPDAILARLREVYAIKSTGEPTFHLGCDYRKETVSCESRAVKNIDKLKHVSADLGDPLREPPAKELGRPTTRTHWFLGTKTYVREALEKCADIMQLKPFTKAGKTISPVEQIRMHKTPIVINAGDHPASDETALCSPIKQRVYQQIMGIALWILICGRYDISFAVSTLSQFCTAPRKGHLERVYHLVGYLRKFPEKWIMIDSSDPGRVPGEDFDPYQKFQEMKELYPDAIEEIDPKAPEPKGRELKTACFFDAAMGSEMTKGRGHSGITLFVGRTPVSQISKRQGTAEASTYGNEFIAGRISCEEVTALRGGLRALGVPINTPTKWYGDNLGMLQSSSLPDSTLKKRHINIAYHVAREHTAAGVILPIKVMTGDNVADTGTKALSFDALDRHNSVLFARPYQTETDIALRKMKLWFTPH